MRAARSNPEAGLRLLDRLDEKVPLFRLTFGTEKHGTNPLFLPASSNSICLSLCRLINLQIYTIFVKIDTELRKSG
jgi:hypothetical protein